MTRTVDDAALLMAELSKPDWRDTMSLPYQAIEWTRLRAGRQRPAGSACRWTPAGAYRSTARSARRGRGRCAGVRTRRRDRRADAAPFSTRAMIDGMDRFWRMRSWLDISALPPSARDKVLPYIRQWVASGVRLTARPRCSTATARWRRCATPRSAACQPYDFVLSPVSPVPELCRRVGEPASTTRSGRSSTSRSRCRTT